MIKRKNYFLARVKFLLILGLLTVLACSDGADQGDSGNIDSKSITVYPESIEFPETMVSKSSATKNINVTPNNLDANIEVNVAGDFQISSDNVNFSNTISIDGNMMSTIYVRFQPTETGEITSNLIFRSPGASNVNVDLTGTATRFRHNYKTFSNQRIAFGGGFNRSNVQSFDLHDEITNIEMIKMYLRLDCPSGGCDPWDRYANILIRDQISNEWYELGRHITPYGVDNRVLDRGLEFDVTDFKSLLKGNVELKLFVDTWVAQGWVISLEFDYFPGTPDYKYYKISRIIQYNSNSLAGVPYGGEIRNGEISTPEQIEAKFDLKKSIQVGPNIDSAHIRTIISGWGHATPADSDGRRCAEWCFRTHNIKIDDVNTFSHYMGPIGCSQNPINNQGGNWTPDRAGWCPGMVVPVRINKFDNNISGKNMSYEYDFKDWVNDFQTTTDNKNGYYAISSFLVLKSNQEIQRATIIE